MGNSNSAQPTDYQVESSEKVTLYECSFQRIEPDVEHVFPNQSGVFYKHLISFTFSVNEDAELLRGILTRDSIFENVVVGQLFPLKRSSELRTGVLEEIGYFNVGNCYCHSIELFVPKSLADRRICGFILDNDNVVVAKARGIVAFEDEFRLNNALESRVSLERASRVEGLIRLSRIEEEQRWKNQIAGISDTLKQLSVVQKSKVEFLEAADNIKLAYRTYHTLSNGGNSLAIFILIAANSHFHDIIASRLSKSHPITVYILEMRGYGYSGGPRGTASFKEQVWADIRTFIRFVKMNSPSIPIFLGGQYFQGGLLLNYSTWREKEPVDGYAFISPNLGNTAIDTTNQQAISRYSEEMRRSPARNSSSSESNYTSLSSLADTLFRRGHEQHYLLSEIEHEINPMIVDLAGPVITRACTSSAPRRQFEQLDKPFGFWVGELEEFLIPEKLVQYPRKSKAVSSINILPNLTHMGVFNVISDYIGDWILTLDAVKKNNLTSEILTQSDIENAVSSGYKHPHLRDMDVVVKSFLNLGLKNGKSSFLLANDGSQIRYQLFTPKSKPCANLILVQSDIKVVLAWILAQKCDIAVYCMDLRGIDNGASCLSKESILNDVKIMVRHLKFNDPEMPLLLGGHGFGASVVLNYSSWKFRESPNGYIFVSPIIDPESNYISDLQTINMENMNNLFGISKASGYWFYNTMRRSYSHSSSMNIISQIQRSSSSPNLDKQAETPHQHQSALWESIVCRNVKKTLADLEIPYGLWVGSDDELVYGNGLVQLLNTSNSNVSLKRVELIPHASHLGNIITSTAYIVPFVRRFTKIVAPSLSFKLRKPCLDDFEKLQFIGRGSFGRVYLVRHKVSDKYFAMKVLSKKEILEAKEVKHVVSERNIMRDLNSSFVVSFVGSFQDLHSLYIVMEYVIGGELYTQLCLKKRLSNDAARFYAAEVILFFEDIHSKNIVYRDLKPENILIDAMGHIKITDLGFSKYLPKNKTYTFCGTPQYLAPEIILNAESKGKSPGYGKAVDYYSLGVLIYEMLLGQTPFHDTNIRSIYRKVLYGVVEFPWGVDAAAKDLIRGLLTRNPSQRLGCGSGQSLDDIKKHRWFKHIDWDRMRRREYSPPFIPRFSHAADTSNFIPWANEHNKKHPGSKEEIVDFGDIFINF